jgi:NADH-quinone oxidoreductase subunit L
MSNYSYILWIPILPLISFIILGLWGRKRLNNIAGHLGVVMLLIAAILSLKAAQQYFLVDGAINGVYQKLIPLKFQWLVFSSTLSIDMGIMVDAISVMMLVVVTFVSLMVHVFSLGYMKGEERYATYYSFLGLFTFSMLGLVLSINIFQMYMFWELVGASSFLLISFYFNKPSAVKASKKAFIVTRFADLGFLIGILTIGFVGGSFDISTLIDTLGKTNTAEVGAGLFGISIATWGLILIFMGGAGKSAMFPLHIWLPDAMEGPTPVSALIHAATMVVAGVYLVARLFPIYATHVDALNVITYVGAFSAIFAAVIACTQTDIKRVLAYSTMSQIGYMMFSLGVARYGGEEGLGFMASMFHLFTHAFFKSLLFLGAGAVIHMVHSNEMTDMGGLRKYMPITHLSFLIGCLAIAGVPPFAGFFSKEEILLATYHHSPLLYGMAIGTAALTSFYMFRLYFNIFWNKEAHLHGEHHGEGTLAMKLPLILLSLLAIGSGLIPFAHYVSSDGKGLETHMDIAFSALPVTLSILAISLAAWMYAKQNDKADKVANTLGGLYKAAYRKFYIDEIYLFVTKQIIFPYIGQPIAWIDKNIVNGFYLQLANGTLKISSSIKNMQSGKLQQYALYFLAGVIGLAILFIYIWK